MTAVTSAITSTSNSSNYTTSISSNVVYTIFMYSFDNWLTPIYAVIIYELLFSSFKIFVFKIFFLYQGFFMLLGYIKEFVLNSKDSKLITYLKPFKVSCLLNTGKEKTQGNFNLN